VLAETKKMSWAVTELPSFILERFNVGSPPHIAVITNLFRDHLNRHGTMEAYAGAKANIFKGQKGSDWLILNQDDAEWTGWFLEQKPHGRVRYFSLRPLPLDIEGVWRDSTAVWEREAGHEQKVLELGSFEQEWGTHNISNLLAAALAARSAGVKWPTIQSRLASIPQVPYCQETIFQNPKLRIINDTTATSPEGGMAALERFGGPGCILITGGTDRELDYSLWAQAVKRQIRKNDIVLLEGSATQKMRVALGPWGRGIRAYPSLEGAVQAAMARSKLFTKAIILFSPAAKSFELFDNEFDRGRQFNDLIKQYKG
jgi:UDP-N-acetylmuramoylalanine--D-glutamate ligase